MLDERDIQIIKELVDTSVNSAVTASEERTQARLDAMDAKFEAKFEAVDKKFDAIDRKFDAIDRKFDAMDRRFDTMEASIDEKFEVMQNHWRVFFETEVMPKFQLLADGHQNLLETLAPKARVDALEEDVVFLKSIVKSLMQEVSELKKAQ